MLATTARRPRRAATRRISAHPIVAAAAVAAAVFAPLPVFAQGTGGQLLAELAGGDDTRCCYSK